MGGGSPRGTAPPSPRRPAAGGGTRAGRRAAGGGGAAPSGAAGEGDSAGLTVGHVGNGSENGSGGWMGSLEMSEGQPLSKLPMALLRGITYIAHIVCVCIYMLGLW